MNLYIKPDPFSFNYKDILYKIESTEEVEIIGKGRTYFTLTEVLTGKEKIVLVMNYNKASENAHLLETLEAHATAAFIIKCIEKLCLIYKEKYNALNNN